MSDDTAHSGWARAGPGRAALHCACPGIEAPRLLLVALRLTPPTMTHHQMIEITRVSVGTLLDDWWRGPVIHVGVRPSAAMERVLSRSGNVNFLVRASLVQGVQGHRGRSPSHELCCLAEQITSSERNQPRRILCAYFEPFASRSR